MRNDCERCDGQQSGCDTLQARRVHAEDRAPRAFQSLVGVERCVHPRGGGEPDGYLVNDHDDCEPIAFHGHA
jgi:hypothetical protein